MTNHDQGLAHVPDEVFQDEFQVWWEDEGQYCRAGGGSYERAFAFQAWRHLYPMLMQARAALNASRDGVAVQEGWRLVPVEPTDDLLEAIHDWGYIGDDGELRQFYQAMLAAAPTPPASDAVPVSRELDVVKLPTHFVRFLLGEKNIDGHSFGDAHPDMPGMFWWRKQLRALLATGGDV